MARISNQLNETLTIVDEASLNSKHTLLVVVDMINGFVVEGNMADPKIAKIIPTQITLMERWFQADQLFFVDAHDKSCQEFKSFPEHCVKGTKESEVVNELLKYTKDAIMIEKNSTNGFLAPDFQQQLDKILSYKNFVIMGCCSDICVLQFALSLQTYIHQYDLDHQVYVVVDGIETYHVDQVHDACEYNEMSIRLMQAAGIQCVKMGDVK